MVLGCDDIVTSCQHLLNSNVCFPGIVYLLFKKCSFFKRAVTSVRIKPMSFSILDQNNCAGNAKHFQTKQPHSEYSTGTELCLWSKSQKVSGILATGIYDKFACSFVFHPRTPGVEKI